MAKIIAKASELGFIPNEDMTLKYIKNASSFITTNTENEGQDITRPVYTQELEGNFKWVAADTLEEATKWLQQQFIEYLASISWLEANPEDFYFRVVYSEVECGFFWKPGTSGRKYRLSDLEIL